ncbi:class I SAM-dependent methyltransferase [Lacinutrix sp. C3R15]|uniref:class I SAM-dependent methyltransferase n=1 Tax=Flavobacteriaceae TaxID=49546 RepID=UPI001C08C17B|nr:MULTISPECIES: class I SAM-dependent methyltransferase [Flavobacteriaceae]MBU2938264.1 class I SAM-dependent methyltransferase [Lacinutrix sp. C3R15]MDO6621578.1 class I SAM-dependent methyltransferase [Oceanihabitans sp. 1_MG-2023]
MKKKEKKIKKPWPTKDAMEQVYAMKLWGDNASSFYSGEGSHNPELVDPYVTAVTSFLKSFNNQLTVCDLGCGDFNIGRQLLLYTKKYIAVDIVEDLITYNKAHFKAENLAFQCLDIAKDNLPNADCVILRQVLQHLSNAEVQSIISKLNNYQYVILTEHVPEGDFTPNLDIVSGQGIRLKKQSGLDVLAAPFNFKVTEVKSLLSVVLKKNKGMVLTTCYKV